MKTNTTVSIDSLLKERAQVKGINISETLEFALQSALEGSSGNLELEVARLKQNEKHLTEELRDTVLQLKLKSDELSSIRSEELRQRIDHETIKKKELDIENKGRLEQKFNEIEAVQFGEKQLWLDTDKPEKWDTPSDNLTIWENARAKFNEAKIKVGYYDMVLYHDYKRLNKNA